MRRGELIGEMAYVVEASRLSDVTAATDGRVLCLSERTLRRMFNEAPTIAAALHRNIARELCTRLQAAGARG